MTKVARRDPIRSAALAAGLLPFAWHVWATLQSYFGQDDFSYIYRAAHQPLGFHYLFPSGYNVHVFPGQFLVVWLATRLAPMNHTVAVLPLLVLQGVAIVMLWRLLVKLFGRRWEILIPFAVYTFSPLLLVTTLWWAFALEIVPFCIALFGAASSLVSYLADGRRRHAVICVLYVAGGLVFWEKAVLIPFVLLGLAIVLTGVDDIVEATRSTLRRYRWLWTMFAGVVVAYAVLYMAVTSLAGGPSSHSRGGVVDLAERMILLEFVPRIIGGPWHANFGGRHSPSAVAVVFACVVVAALVRKSLANRRPQTILAWGIVAGFLLADVVLLAVARLDAIGSIIGNDPRYVTDAVPVAVIFGALALMPPITLSGASTRAAALNDHSSLQLDAHRSRRLRLLAGAFVLGAVMSVSATQGSQMNGVAKRYTESALAAMHHASYVVFDGGLPADVMLPTANGDWRVSRVIGLFPSAPRFDAPTDQLVVLDEKGIPEPFTFFFPVSAPPGPVPQCGYLTSSTGTTVPLPMTTPHVAIELSYYTGQTSKGFVLVDGHRFNVTFQANGVRDLYVVAQKPFTSIQVGSGFPTCVVGAIAGGPPPFGKLSDKAS